LLSLYLKRTLTHTGGGERERVLARTLNLEADLDAGTLTKIVDQFDIQVVT